MMKNILIAGITGLIGQKLTTELKNQYTIKGLVRNKLKSREIIPDVELFEWNETEDKLIKMIEESDIVINLSGRSIAKGRWTEKVKRDIYNSRILTTKRLADLILKARTKPELFIAASAVGYYGLDINQVYDENSPPSDDFLGKLCVDWEKASEVIENAGVRRVNLRISTVLSLDGGALPLVSLPFKFFIGTYFGTGKQYFPWIHEKDLVRLVKFIIENNSITGAINAVSPQSITMKEFCKTLGKVLNRPCLFKIPEWSVKIIFGEMGNLLIKGGRVLPKKAIESGFKFEFDELEKALRDLFNA